MKVMKLHCSNLHLREGILKLSQVEYLDKNMYVTNMQYLKTAKADLHRFFSLSFYSVFYMLLPRVLILQMAPWEQIITRS